MIERFTIHAAGIAVSDPAPGGSHQLVAALIGSLPAIGASFPAEQRADWLKMMAMTFNLAYGPAEDIPDFLGATHSKAAALQGDDPPATKPKKIVGNEPPRYYIAKDGRALQDPGAKPLTVNDIPRDETLWDERPLGMKDLDTIIWADGTWPPGSLPPLNIANG